MQLIMGRGADTEVRAIPANRWSLGLAVAVAASLIVRPAAAAATSQTVDITGTFRLNECTGETVTLSGEVHLVTSTTVNADGSFNVVMHANTRGVTGAGDFTGFTYNFNETTNQQSDFDIVSGGTQRDVYHLEFIHRGEFGGVPDPTFDDKHVHFNVTVAVDEFGNPIVVPVPDYECR